MRNHWDSSAAKSVPTEVNAPSNAVIDCQLVGQSICQTCVERVKRTKQFLVGTDNEIVLLIEANSHWI